MFKETAKELLEFIEKSPSCFHAVKIMKNMAFPAYFLYLETQFFIGKQLEP